MGVELAASCMDSHIDISSETHFLFIIFGIHFPGWLTVTQRLYQISFFYEVGGFRISCQLHGQPFSISSKNSLPV